ncbi:M20 aminoacylase family protein [Trinickia soli]|uniref:Amidohydrolase n=1 Tax=Trinickia soli TaxID=380675 RepID=A0A2N7VV07_9BURK|nr:M20 aminoacylase family protein [Trinickia soli]KAA0089677.1 amidohydrolase [Paraburkholderia sp. T12-10]PMS20981.1 amidohydrolase [Trinickia soli]CAB3665101.1 Hippurate hydrolase [Trinickia soli]
MSESRYCEVADLAEAKSELDEIRHHLHRHPELSYEEADTSDFVADKLTGWGYDVTRNIGGHGLVASLKAGTSARTVGVRADMDALPIKEETGLDYASIHDGKMHACGHDGHTAVLLGAAQHLAKTRRFDGTVHLIFQPAEETGYDSGAQRMIADGLFERFPCEAIFGLHNHPGVPAGTFGFRAGPMMAAADRVKVRIHGRGGHAARPHLTIDPVVVGSSIVMALQTIVSRNVDPNEAAVVTVGSFRAGHAPNVIPEDAVLEMSVRSFSPEVRDTLEQRIRTIVAAQAEAYGAKAEIDFIRGYPVLINSEAETEFARNVAEELVGPEHVIAPFPPMSGSEDFAYYLQQRPGCFFRLGNGAGRPMLHSAHYDFNDENLTIGAAFWTRLVERFLSKEQA